MKNIADFNTGFFDKRVEAYHEKNKNTDPDQKEHVHEFLSHIPAGGSILDLACGPGRDAKTFTELGYSVLGIDYSEKMLEKARQVAPDAEYKRMELTQLDLDDTFDSIWFCAGLLFIEKKNADTLLNKLHSYLRPNGVLCLVTKEGEGEGWTLDSRVNTERFHAFYTHDELKTLLQESGFNILNSYRVEKEYTWLTYMCKK